MFVEAATRTGCGSDLRSSAAGWMGAHDEAPKGIPSCF